MKTEKTENQVPELNRPVRMVVCDLDGTLLYSPSKITERTKQAIRDLRSRGILFGICSGRSAVALKKMIRIWGIENDVDFVLGFNGGQFWDPQSDTFEEVDALDADDIQPILDACRGFSFGFGEYQGESMLTTRKNPLSMRMASRNRLNLETVSPEALKQPALKLMAFGMPWTVSKWLRSPAPRSLKNARVFRSGPFLLEFVYPDLSKLEGVRRAAERYGISLDEVVSFGNDNNDLEMLAGTQGVAMANALEPVRRAAKFQTASNRKDGVAEFIERKILTAPDARSE